MQSDLGTKGLVENREELMITTEMLHRKGVRSGEQRGRTHSCPTRRGNCSMRHTWPEARGKGKPSSSSFGGRSHFHILDLVFAGTVVHT